MSAVDRRFKCMGTDMRLIVDDCGFDGVPETPSRAFGDVRAYLQSYDLRLSRFRPDSDLSRLNAAGGEMAAASPLLRALVRAAVWAADRSDGLVDPTLVDELDALGYSRPWPLRKPVPLAGALHEAPPRRPAAPRAERRWRKFRIDDELGAIWRPPGIKIDSGGVGKGLAADAAALRLASMPRFLVDCGGDLTVGGTLVSEIPFEVAVPHPLTAERAHVFRVAGGAIATSGIDRRIWRRDDGTLAHHLLDPASGAPAWTGVIAATALGDTCFDADRLAKTAVLLGPAGARKVLAEHGGLFFHDSGRVEIVPAPARPTSVPAREPALA
jgi:FAD:protein FMN transferase